MFQGLHDKIESLRTFLASADAFLKNIQKFLFDLGDITRNSAKGKREQDIQDVEPLNQD